MRYCSFCNSGLTHGSGYDESGGNRAGNSKEVDYFVCDGCEREYCHVYRERFSGDSEFWDVRTKTDSDWKTLEKRQWPTSSIKQANADIEQSDERPWWKFW